MPKKIALIILSSFTLSACQTKPISPLADANNVIVNSQSRNQMTPSTTISQPSSNQKLPTSATINTSLGPITLELFPQKAPLAVENFVGLATGNKIWINPKTGKKTSDPLYKNLIFHRVIKDFMIQGGDPLGDGTGGPGYSFKDEFNKDLVFDKKGVLAMANNGPNTNGSQFFITLVPTPWLNGKHTIFGQVISGFDTVEKIGNTETNNSNRPVKDIIIESINVETASAQKP